MDDRDKRYRKTEIAGKPLHPETMMMGYGYDPHMSEGALKSPIFQTSTFAFKSAKDGKEFFDLLAGRKEAAKSDKGLIYSRFNNPNFEVLEDRLALWEKADDGLVFSSGMAAISTALWTFLRPGDVVLYSAPLYGGTQVLIETTLPQFGIKNVGFTAGQPQAEIDEAVARAKAQGNVTAIFLETPANPNNALVDLEYFGRVADEIGKETGKRPPIIVDNTFLGPLWQHPLEHGCDIVVYSLTKYVGGHSDIVAGACVGAKDNINRIRSMRNLLGTNTDSHTCWLVSRSLETLKLRMTAAMENARHVAEFLAGHDKIERVDYLGFLDKDDPEYAIFKRQCASPGSTFTFDVKGGEEEAFRLLDNLQVIKLAVSLGGTESLISHPWSTTHSGLDHETLRKINITPAMIRLSVGIEHASDLVADLEQALKAV